eukprot:2870993-Prymnesium_polylepis.1
MRARLAAVTLPAGGQMTRARAAAEALRDWSSAACGRCSARSWRLRGQRSNNSSAARAERF